MTEAILNQLANGIMMGSIYVLVALGMVLVYGVMHVLNFAHGVLFMLGGYFAHLMFTQWIDSYFLSVLFAMAVLFVIGAGLERTVFRPLRGNLRNQVLASLGLILIVQNLVIYAWGPTGLQFTVTATERLVPVGVLRFSVQHFLIIGITFAGLGLLHLFLTRTKFGTGIRATSQNHEAAMVVGINVNRMYWLTFAAGTALAGLGGALLGPLFLVFPAMGDPLLVKGLASILLGGMGSIPGAVIGGLIIGVTESLSTMVIPTGYKDSVTFLAIVLILLLRPRGLFGVRVREED